MAVVKYTAKLTNSNVDATNYQLVGFDFDASDTATQEEHAARIIGYLGYLGSVSVIATGSKIAEVSVRVGGSAGGVALPFPTTEYAALVTAAAAAGITLPAMASGYATAIGGDALAPLGTSISVTEQSATVGPTGRGRHFLPFISRATVAANGTVGAAPQADIVQLWEAMLDFFDPTYVTSGGSTFPTITNAAGSTANSIRFVKPQPVFSNLESRRR